VQQLQTHYEQMLVRQLPVSKISHAPQVNLTRLTILQHKKQEAHLLQR